MKNVEKNLEYLFRHLVDKKLQGNSNLSITEARMSAEDKLTPETFLIWYKEGPLISHRNNSQLIEIISEATSKPQ
jgi:hypothetical protein